MTELVPGEHRLVLLARAAATGTGAAGAILRDDADLGRDVGPTALALVREALSRGTVRRLAAAGWAERRWERETPPLTFTSDAVRLLAWAVRAPLGRSTASPPDIDRMRTLGDELVALGLAGHLVRHQLLLAVAQPPFTTSALCVLAYGEVLPAAVDWDGWTSGERASVLAYLQRDLADGAERFERAILATPTADRQIALGEAREAALDGLISAAQAADRLELLDFLATARLPLGRAPADQGVTLLRRQRAGHATGAQPRAVLRLGRIAEEARAVRFFEDGYDAAQALLRRWRGLDAARLRAMEAEVALRGDPARA